MWDAASGAGGNPRQRVAMTQAQLTAALEARSLSLLSSEFNEASGRRGALEPQLNHSNENKSLSTAWPSTTPPTMSEAAAQAAPTSATGPNSKDVSLLLMEERWKRWNEMDELVDGRRPLSSDTNDDHPPTPQRDSTASN